MPPDVDITIFGTGSLSGLQGEDNCQFRIEDANGSTRLELLGLVYRVRGSQTILRLRSVL